METVLNILLGLAMAAVVIVLFRGVLTFMKGGPENAEKSQRLMNMRVGTQAVALVIFALVLGLAALSK